MPNNGYSAPCVTSQPGPWDDDGDWNDYALDEATNEWDSIWADSPEVPYLKVGDGKTCVDKAAYRKAIRAYLITAFTKMVDKYDGSLVDIEDHLSEFYDKWVEARADAMIEQARQDYEEAKADAYADRDDW